MPVEVAFQNGIHFLSEFLPEALAAFSSRDFDATRNLSAFLKTLGLSDARRFVTIHQVHDDKVVAVTTARLGEETDADALVTDERNLTLVIRTADCLPVFFLDRHRRAIGLSHAGWRGAKKGIVSETVEALQRHFGSEPSSLEVALGPAICHSCYEVGNEFLDYFPGWVETRGGRYFFDLRGYVKHKLLEAGIARESMVDYDVCTSCSVKLFFSARREGIETGRFLSAIMLK